MLFKCKRESNGKLQLFNLLRINKGGGGGIYHWELTKRITRTELAPLILSFTGHRNNNK